MKKTFSALVAVALAFNARAQFPQRNPTPNDTLQSIKILVDGTVKFSIYAPKANEVTVSGDFPTGFPAQKLTKNEIGVWSFTTPRAVKPNVYTYDFNVDGLRVFDPKNAQFKESNNGFSNLFEVKGAENDFQTLKDVPHGKVEKVLYKSSALNGITRRLHVYLPPNYDEISKKQKLPVLYLLHGGGDNDASWTTVGRTNLILDNLYAEGKLKPMIVVMPAGHTPIQGFFMGAGDQQDPFCRDVVQDVIPFIEKTYPISNKREHRAIAGLSMGGIQTINLALWHPDLFSQVFPLSTGYFPNTIAEIKEKYSSVMKNPTINTFKDFKIYMGGESDIAYQNNLNMMKMFDEFGIKYKYINGEGGHTFLAWRKNLQDFAPILFK
ncbi:MAG: alpha/beta hydrolase-fold protein [Spirosomataceae bacterium]